MLIFFCMDLSEALSHLKLLPASGSISHASETLEHNTFSKFQGRNMDTNINYKAHVPEELAKNTSIHSFSNLIQLLAQKAA